MTTHAISIDTEKGIVTKTLLNGVRVDPKAMTAYKEMTIGNSNYVQVYDIIDNNTFTMEYIPNVLDSLDTILKFEKYNYLLTKKFILNAFNVFHNLFLDGLKITQLYNDYKEDDLYFVNVDAKLANILVTKDGNFKVIDPDSYQWVPSKNLIGVMTPYYMAEINLAMHLQKSLLESK